MEDRDNIESARLELRRIESIDAGFLMRYLQDPVLTRYLPSGMPYSKDKILEYLEERKNHWRQFGHGTYMVFLKSTGQRIGYCGLEYVSDTGCVDIRYGILPECWGRGFAREAALRCITSGFSDYAMQIIYAAVEKENIPSRKVLEKVGMQPCADVNFYGDAVLYYCIEKSVTVAG